MKALRFWPLWLLALLVVAALIERHDEPGRAYDPASMMGASWIWETRASKGMARPVVFFAARDFDLESVPEGAEVLAVADEEFRLFVNGRLVSAGRRPPGRVGAVDRRSVSGLLHGGANRVSVELRSRRGAGAFLFCLRVGERCFVQSDETWRTTREYSSGIHAGWWPTEAGEPARVWGRNPVGRWSLSADLAEAVPPLDTCLEPQTVTHEERPSSTSPEGAGLGASLFDLGVEARGFLSIERVDGEPSVAWLRWARRREELTTWNEAETRPVIMADAARQWVDVEPAEARFVEVTGPLLARGVRLQPLSSGCWVESGSDERSGSSLFGVEPRASKSPMENEVRSQVQSTLR